MKILICLALLSQAIAVFAAETPASYPAATSPTSAPVVVDVPPHSLSGLYAAEMNSEAVLGQPFVKGMRIAVQWADLEPQEGNYDFASIDAQLKKVNGMGKTCLLEIQGERKPEWLFAKSPYWPEKLPGANEEKGTLMYWHPAYLNAQMKMLGALGSHLKALPERTAIAAISMRLNAIGSDQYDASATVADRAKWVLPEGVAADAIKDWSPAIALNYAQDILYSYASAFQPDFPVLVPSLLKDSVQRYAQDFNTGSMGWMVPAIEPTQTLVGAAVAPVGLESTGDAFQSAEMQPAQENYWRILRALAAGFDMILAPSSDLQVGLNGTHPTVDAKAFHEDFLRSFEFAGKYAGFLYSPSKSPGAWIALKPADETPDLKIPAPKMPVEDCAFLMNRLPDISRAVANAGPPAQRHGKWARVLPPHSVMRFKVDETLAESMKGAPSILSVVYLDDHEGKIKLSGSGHIVTIPLENSGQWRTAISEIPDTALELNEMSGEHLIVEAGAHELTLHMVEFRRAPPVEMQEGMLKFGN